LSYSDHLEMEGEGPRVDIEKMDEFVLDCVREEVVIVGRGSVSEVLEEGVLKSSHDTLKGKESKEEAEKEVTRCLISVSVTVFVDEALKVAEELGMMGKDSGDMVLLEKTFEDAFTMFGSDLGINEAREYGKGFVFPLDEIKKDAERLVFEFDCSLANMAKSIFDGCYATRFNEDKVRSLQVYDVNFKESYEDWHRLFEVAKNGVMIPLPSGFEPTTVPRKLRSTYMEVHEAVNKTLCNYREKKFCLILPNDVLSEVKETLHYNDMHWVTKVQAPEGRTIADVSACDLGKFALNCPEVKIAGIEFCGVLSHPVIVDYVTMVIEAKKIYAKGCLCSKLTLRMLSCVFG